MRGVQGSGFRVQERGHPGRSWDRGHLGRFWGRGLPARTNVDLFFVRPGWPRPQKRAGCPRSNGAALATLLTIVLAFGCTQPKGEILVAPLEGPYWPAAADARVRYVGSLRSEEDLKPAKSFWRQLVGTDDQDIKRLVAPISVAVDPTGVVYVADTDTKAVHRFDLNARTHALIGQGTIELPSAVAWWNGHLFIADSKGGGIYVTDGGPPRRFNRDTIARPAGIAGGTMPSQPFTTPGVGMSPNLFVSDLATASVHVLDFSGQTVQTFPQTTDPAEALSSPTHLAYHHKTRLLVSDTLSSRIVRFDQLGNRLGTIGAPGDAPGDLAMPRGVAVDSAGHVYVVDARFENVQIFDVDGRVLLDFGREGTGPGQFSLPAGICIDSHDRIWVADTYNCRVQVFQFLGAPESTARPALATISMHGGNSDDQ